jgi:glycosyltransferase involved in cell wall biosynthesis
LEQFVIITGTCEDIGNELQQAEIGVLSSLSEGLPVALLEYGLAGLPVVVTDAGQCKEVVDNGNAGICVGVGNTVQLADALKKLLTDKIYAEELGNKLQQRVSIKYGKYHFYNAYISFLNTLN